MSPGDLVRDARRRHGLSQSRLAVRAGTTQTAISRLERGDRSPSTETLRRVLLTMGEELDLRTRRLRGEHDPAHLRAERALAPGQRLDRAFRWMRFNASVLAAARRARR